MYNSQANNKELFNKRLLIAILALTLLPLKFTLAQEVTITDFPLGVGGSADTKLFEPYYDDLQALVDTLNANPEAHAIVTGSTDGVRYSHSNDAINSGLALGRAHTLRNLLVNKFNVDTSRIVIQSIDVEKVGGQYRSASVRVARDISDLKTVDARLDAQIDTVVTMVGAVGDQVDTLGAILDAHLKEPQEVGIRLGAGLSSSPFGAVPIVTAGVTWNHTVFIGGTLGHTVWNGDFTASTGDLSTKRRMSGIQVTAFPLENKNIGIIAGWTRIEEISQDFYEYVQLSEGPTIGALFMPNDFLIISGAYNPAKHRKFETARSETKNNQFQLSVTAHVDFGGLK